MTKPNIQLGFSRSKTILILQVEDHQNALQAAGKPRTIKRDETQRHPSVRNRNWTVEHVKIDYEWLQIIFNSPQIGRGGPIPN